LAESLPQKPQIEIYMNFFIPTKKPSESEQFLNQSIIPFIESYGYKILKEKRVYSITFIHNGKEITDTVDRISISNDEVVFVILETNEMFLVCTPRRGITGGEPMLINKKSIISVKYFSDNKNDQLKFGDWTYKLVNGNHEVESLQQTPERVYKYYGKNENSINAVLEQYLFCSHPYHLNDSMDSSNLLWDFSTLTEPLFNKFYEQYGISSEFEVNYQKDKELGFPQIKELFYTMITNHTGIISLTTEPLHTLMWAHYASEKGFMIELDWKTIKDNLKVKNPKLNNYVFFPIQYVENLEPINFFSENLNSADVPFLYSVAIKRKDWQYENEWRLMSYAKDYGIPNSIFSMLPGVIGSQERKLFYPKEAIKSITLGKNFFNTENVESVLEPFTFKMKNSIDLKLIEFIIENVNDKVFFCGEYEINRTLKRSTERISITKLDETTIKINRHNEGNHQ
jgi:hypothetical protein